MQFKLKYQGVCGGDCRSRSVFNQLRVGGLNPSALQSGIVFEKTLNVGDCTIVSGCWLVVGEAVRLPQGSYGYTCSLLPPV